jgi:hypothetical protein
MGNFAYNPFAGMIQLFPKPALRYFLIIDADTTLTPAQFSNGLIGIKADSQSVELTLPDPSLVLGQSCTVKVLNGQYGFSINQQIDGEVYESTGTGDIINITTDGLVYYRI